PSWESCCMRGSVQPQLLPDPPEYLKNLLASTDTQGRHFKNSLRQYNAAFAFTSLGCDIVSGEDRANNNNNNSNSNNNRDGLYAFQIHGILCHRQGPLIPVKGSEHSYAQLYIFDPSYAAEIRQARNSNLDPKIIMELSAMLAYNNDQTETIAPHIVISPSMRMHLIKGSDRHTYNLLIMEEIATVIPIEYSDKGYCDIVLTLRGNNSLCQNIGFEQRFQRISQTHAAYVCTNFVLIFHHGTYGRHYDLCFFFSLFTITSSITVSGA
ncbi:hypothetical protein BCV71DRAFT_190687, partial [Rhizopus microsporus]